MFFHALPHHIVPVSYSHLPSGYSIFFGIPPPRYAGLPLSQVESYEKSSAILLMQSGLVPNVERGGSPDAIWWYLNASGVAVRTRFCTSPDAIKIIPDAFRYQLK